eukprot:2260142-Rhodomonas_salina.4
MLLQTSPSSSEALRENEAGVSGAAVAYEVTPVSLMARALEVPEDKVALFNLEVRLTSAEACLGLAALQDSLRLALLDMLADTASAFLTLQITSLEVDRGEEACGGRRSLRKLLGGFSSAAARVQMLVVFAAGAAARFDLAALAQHPAVTHVQPDPRNSPKLHIVPLLDCSSTACGQ